MEKILIKPSAQIYVNKIENGVTFKIKNEYSLELLTPETMKLKYTSSRNYRSSIGSL